MNMNGRLINDYKKSFRREMHNTLNDNTSKHKYQEQTLRFSFKTKKLPNFPFKNDSIACKIYYTQ